MFEDQQALIRATEAIVEEMLAEGIAEKRFYTDRRLGQEYWILAGPGAMGKELVAVAVLGYPELAGVWSYTLLSQGRAEETSMAPYFRRFGAENIGLVAINPNLVHPDIEGESFVCQLEGLIAELTDEQKLAFLGFSMGGKVLVQFLEGRPALLKRTSALVLIDPTLPNRLKIENIRALLDRNTLLVASESDQPSPGKVASVLLDVPAVCFRGIHGQMPNKALERILAFLKDKRGR